MPGVAHLAALRIVLEREKKRKAKLRHTPFEEYILDLVEEGRYGARFSLRARPPPFFDVLVPTGLWPQRLCLFLVACWTSRAALSQLERKPLLMPRSPVPSGAPRSTSLFGPTPHDALLILPVVRRPPPRLPPLPTRDPV